MKRLLTFLDRIGSVGVLLVATAVPCCFSLFAGVITTVGLVTLGNFESFALYALQGFALLSSCLVWHSPFGGTAALGRLCLALPASSSSGCPEV